MTQLSFIMKSKELIAKDYCICLYSDYENEIIATTYIFIEIFACDNF